MTEWRPVVGYEGLYEVSDNGQVKSLPKAVPGRPGEVRRLPEKILRGNQTRQGCISVRLTARGDVGKSRSFQVHNLMLEAFVGPRPAGLFPIHRDDVPDNNVIDNLHWGTAGGGTRDLREVLLESYGEKTLEEVAEIAGSSVSVLRKHVGALRRKELLPTAWKSVIHVEGCYICRCDAEPFEHGMCERHHREREERRRPRYLAPSEGEWRPVAWAPEYQVHYTGLIRGVSGRILSPATRKYGHKCVGIRYGGKAYYRYVHQLVLNAFVGPCPPGYEGCHIDGDPANNRLDNLYWGTRSDNYLDRVLHGTHHFAKRNACSNGHEYIDGSYAVYSGARHCLICKAANNSRYRQRDKLRIDLSQESA